MEKCKVSVIITTYKRPFEILSRAIDSALTQTHQNFEIIVVDDSPDSPEREMLKNRVKEVYSDRLLYIQNPKNLGACASRNIAIKCSTGQYIALLDDDDQWLPNKNALMLQCFGSGEIGLVYCNYLTYHNGAPIRVKARKKYDGSVLPQLLESNFIGGCSIPLIPRKVFDDCGMFDERLPASQDTDLYRRIAKKYQIKYLDDPLVIYHFSDVSISSSQERQIRGRLMLLEKYKEEYAAYPKIKMTYFGDIFVGLIASKRSEEAWALFRKECGLSFISFVGILPFWGKGLIKKIYWSFFK
ncbi:glycosyltransferase [Sphaerochaeta sp. PS]|uniref:glycosyltransferase family 2 protein n=1 Tax=Sphaerochaeta sp. PS TaxID=3076336 RepID=UPI0028A431CE|nr:glycosyltransferase [Sphaerochaeta sp. PS]MDT4762161.1 glycosyltransferase [Sphaerochaeta sp. PS]